MRLLVTRPAGDAQRTAAALCARGHEVRIAPLLRIEATPGADLGSPPWQASRRFGAAAPLLYLAGSDRARDLGADLAPHGIAVRTVEIYRAHAAEELPAEIVAALRASDIDGVLHFSRRSCEIFVQCAERAGVVAAALRPIQFCISAQAAEPLARAGAGKIRIAVQPEEDALVALIEAA